MYRFDRLQPWSLLIMRVAAGAIVLNHGWLKFHQPGTMLFLEFRHLPLWLSAGAAYFEMLVGALLILGVVTRWAAAATCLYMVVATLIGHLPIGHQLQSPAALFALSLALLAYGPGELALLREKPAAGAARAAGR